MTVSFTPRKAGPFTGDGSQSSWPFEFKVFVTADITVTLGDAAGNETVLALDSDYTVTLNSNQDTSPGGAVDYLVPANMFLSITGNTAYEQQCDIPAGGNFNPVALENQLDRTTMQIQQLAEKLERVDLTPVTQQPGTAQYAFYNYTWYFTADGATTDFEYSYQLDAAILLDVYLDGVWQIPGEDYSVTGRTVTFGTAPASGLKVCARMLFAQTA